MTKNGLHRKGTGRFPIIYFYTLTISRVISAML